MDIGTFSVSDSVTVALTSRFSFNCHYSSVRVADQSHFTDQERELV